MEYLDRRDIQRAFVAVTGCCSMDDGAEFSCEIVDLSYVGARLKTELKGRIDALISLKLPYIETLKCQIVRITTDGFAVEFKPDDEESQLTAIIFLGIYYLMPEVDLSDGVSTACCSLTDDIAEG